ncbi:MAG TPA: tetratricopeptide repeat protein [Polyangia bacterium]|nr:tetratricopeptide repeat protein [Polyangia bacterium]
MFASVALAVVLAAPAFWERVADPHRAQVEALIARARGEMLSGKDGPGRAEKTLREALRFDPGSFTATMLLGEAQVGQGQRAAAALSFGRARALARTPAEESRCSLLAAIENSRAGRFDQALAEYDQHIRLGEAEGDAYTNSAEILMALGRLGEAQDRYREAIRLEDQARPAIPGHDRDEYLALAYYGLGVALDRDEQGQAAREAIARAVLHDPRMALLDAARDGRSDVFFVPPGDVHYYRGLALMVMGRPREATDAFQRFLTEQRQSRWGKRAETHLLALAAGVERGRSRLRLVASGTVHADEGISAPVIDALLRNHPDVFERCLDDAPGNVNETTRVSLEVELDSAGVVQQVKGPGPEWASFVGCASRRLKEALRLPRGTTAKSGWIRLDLVLAVRR